jgi:hypothetical protein
VAKAVEMQLKVRASFPLELLVRTPEKVRERLEMGDGFMREILTKGKVLYEAQHQWMAGKGRRGTSTLWSESPGIGNELIYSD